jgi:cobalt/nickel transport system ATP-binding protein
MHHDGHGRQSWDMRMGDTNLIIGLEDVSFAYPNGPPILDSVSVGLRRGDRMGLLGPNGSGKTTLFHVIMGLLQPTSGTLRLFGQRMRDERDFGAVRPRIGLLFQDADDQLFSPTVLEDVAFGPLNLGKTRQEALGIATRTLELLGLSGFEDRVTFKLSGGEKRLVSLATVLAMEPEVLLLDEPTTGLDERTKEKLIAILSGLDLSYVLISHEFDFLAEVTDAVWAMDKGRTHTDEAARVHLHYHRHPHGHFPHEHE